MKIMERRSNYTVIRMSGNLEVLFSYDTPVAGMQDGKFFQTTRHWSVTTTKHINRYLQGVRPVEEKTQDEIEALVD